jgi:2'-5' RNA ligase
MRSASAYRYFLCFLPDESLRREIALLHQRTGQLGGRVSSSRAHLSLVVFGAPKERNAFLAPRVDAALAGEPLRSCVVRLGRVRGGPHGATLFTRGRKGELTALRRRLLARLAARGIVPEFAKTNPHITLGYDPCRCADFDVAVEWIPREIVLIESEHGLRRHNRLASWSLLEPEQAALPFGSQVGELRLAS